MKMQDNKRYNEVYSIGSWATNPDQQAQQGGSKVKHNRNMSLPLLHLLIYIPILTKPLPRILYMPLFKLTNITLAATCDYISGPIPSSQLHES